MPLDGRPRDADDRARRRARTLTPAFPGTRPRSAATGSSPRCRCCGAIPRSPKACCGGSPRIRPQIRSARRRRARKNPARDARRRNGGAARGSVRPVLRQRRCDAAVRDAGRALRRAHRRHRNAARAVAQHRSGAGLDRRAGRSRPRRLRRISPRRREGPGQSGLEGLRTTRSFMPTARSRKGPIALCEVQGYVYAAKRLAARARARLGKHASATRSMRRLQASPNDSRRRSGARTSAPMRSRSTGRSGRAGCGPRTPGRCCSAALPRRSAQKR